MPPEVVGKDRGFLIAKGSYDVGQAFTQLPAHDLPPAPAIHQGTQGRRDMAASGAQPTVRRLVYWSPIHQKLAAELRVTAVGSARGQHAEQRRSAETESGPMAESDTNHAMQEGCENSKAEQGQLDNEKGENATV